MTQFNHTQLIPHLADNLYDMAPPESIGPKRPSSVAVPAQAAPGAAQVSLPALADASEFQWARANPGNVTLPNDVNPTQGIASSRSLNKILAYNWDGLRRQLNAYLE